MKNFLIIVLAFGLAGAAFMTRPDREEFERYLAERQQPATEKPSTEKAAFAFFKKRGDSKRDARAVDIDRDDIEFKDFYLWTVVRQKDGKTLYTGVFDRWIDNEMVKQTLPS
jgi:hypothetical protein